MLGSSRSTRSSLRSEESNGQRCRSQKTQKESGSAPAQHGGPSQASRRQRSAAVLGDPERHHHSHPATARRPPARDHGDAPLACAGERQGGREDRQADRRRRLAIRSTNLHSSVLVIGAHSEEAFGRSFAKAFGAAARFLSDLSEPGSGPQAGLAVGVGLAGDAEEQRTFAAQAHQAKVPALGVVLGTREALIGPLALPGRPGCGRCAWERMTAAAASAGIAEEPAPTDSLREVADLAAPLLIREVRTILRRGPAGSRLLDHVLAIDAETGKWSLHRVIPLSRCGVCGGAAAYPLPHRESVRLSSDDPPEVVLAALAGWLDPRTGVISRFVLEPDETGADLPLVATAAPPHVVEEDGSL